MALTTRQRGKRREVAWAAFLPVPASLWQTQLVTRGFTGHEQLDPVGLVHMNGRVYDPELGRFLSADPHIQDVTNGQALNRYSYVLNNPLSFTDPSGFFFQSLFKAIGHAVGAVFRAIGRVFSALLKSSIFRSIVQIAACTFGGPPGCAAAAAGLTLASGGSIQDAFMAAAFSVASAYIYTEVGDFLDGAGAFEQVATHGVVGGALEVAQGGEFHTGFISGAAGKAASVYSRPGTELGNALGGGTSPARVAFVATVGGTSSVLTGGKFGNGAVTAAFGHLFNELNSAQGYWDQIQQGIVQGFNNALESVVSFSTDVAWAVTPGSDVYDCYSNGCGIVTGTIAAASVLPGGKLVSKALNANPFLGKTAKQIDEMFRAKGFTTRGPDPMNGKGDYLNPKTQRPYHNDANHPAPKPGHVTVGRPESNPLLQRQLPAREYLTD